jgi:hypothetical protein
MGLSTLTCSGPSRDHLSNVYGLVLWNWDECGGLHGPFYNTGYVLILLLQGLGKGPPQRPGCQYSEAVFKPLQHEQAV